MYDAVTRAVLTDAPVLAEDGPTAAAVAFRTVVPGLLGLTDIERALLAEWLDRAARHWFGQGGQIRSPGVLTSPLGVHGVKSLSETVRFVTPFGP